jgi:hypothetical protein
MEYIYRIKAFGLINHAMPKHCTLYYAYIKIPCILYDSCAINAEKRLHACCIEQQKNPDYLRAFLLFLFLNIQDLVCVLLLKNSNEWCCRSGRLLEPATGSEAIRPPTPSRVKLASSGGAVLYNSTHEPSRSSQ